MANQAVFFQIANMDFPTMFMGQTIQNSGTRNQDAIPKNNLLETGNGLMQKGAVRQRRKHAHGIQIFKSYNCAIPRGLRRQRSLVVPSKVTYGAVERREEPLVSGR